jgi:hypothetical protein
MVPKLIKRDPAKPRPKPVRLLQLVQHLKHLKYALLNYFLGQITPQRDAEYMLIKTLLRDFCKSVQTLPMAKLSLPN